MYVKGISGLAPSFSRLAALCNQIMEGFFLYNCHIILCYFLQALLDTGVSLDIETPSSGSLFSAAVNGETQHWTALTYAAAKGHTRCARLLLERGASVEGGAQLSEDRFTVTPLQVRT